jgi:hypothetical protein
MNTKIGEWDDEMHAEQERLMDERMEVPEDLEAVPEPPPPPPPLDYEEDQ